VSARPAFEAASVKLADPPKPGSNPLKRGGPGTGDPGRIVYPYVSLLELLTTAFDVNGDQFSGPAWLWIPEEMYSVEATLPPNATREQFREMLQNLLAERFHLAVHHSTKAFPVYELTLASGGPKITPAAKAPNDAPAPSEDVDKNGFPMLRPGSSGQQFARNGVVRGRYRITMAEFATRLGGMVSVSNSDEIIGLGVTIPRVVDRTGLTGEFEFTLEFAGSVRLPATIAAARGEKPATPTEAAEPNGGVSLFTALEKQLGLKLVKGRTANLDLLVIDNVNRVPTEN
jgi:uncharacterized protein (TIGR03435 family)